MSVMRLSIPPAALFFLLGLLNAAAQQPNIVFIMADDMGYGDVHALSPRSKIPTPNLDRLAAEGMSFLDAHTPSGVCTPTRYGLMTGRYSWRGRLKKGVLDGYGEPLIEDGRPTVASFLNGHGYQTAVVGKWHLGLGFVRKSNHEDIDFTRPVSDGPHTRGFGFSHVIPASLDFPPYVYVRNGSITRSDVVLQSAVEFPGFLRRGMRGSDLVPENCLDDLLGEATAYIRERSGEEQPFFLYFPLTAPHKPALPHPRFERATNLGPYADFVVQVDWTVGEVLRALETAGVAESTLVIFTSDNGSYMRRLGEGEPDHAEDAGVQGYRPDSHTPNDVYRGTKADIYEAGHHVPFFARWPGKIRAGSQTPNTICLTDFFATAAEIVGAELPSDVAEDSFSLLPLFKGKGWSRPRAPVIHHSSEGMFAIRDGKWKLVAGNGSGGRELPKGEPFGRPYMLFDMETDRSERKSVITANPEVAKRLEAELERLRTSGRSR
jgi:arylsulfatase A-like enzyme